MTGAANRPISPVEIRRAVIRALFSDDTLSGLLVLKGGNALELVHGVIQRGSLDIDVSIAGQFEDAEAIESRMVRALDQEFRPLGLLVFDADLQPRPSIPDRDVEPTWGGYRLEFKLITFGQAGRLGHDLESMRRQATPVDFAQRRRFGIDISKFEWCDGKVAARFDGRTVFVYTEEMCAIEKLRAICQQMPEYGRAHPTPRARDFYDVHAVLTRRAIDLALPENLELFRQIFDAKQVPLRLLARISHVRDFHEPDWEAVRSSVVGDALAFDDYFRFVVGEVERLHALWDE